MDQHNLGRPEHRFSLTAEGRLARTGPTDVVFAFIRGRLRSDQQAPTYKEVRTETGLGRTAVCDAIDELVHNGKLTRKASSRRGVGLPCSELPDLNPATCFVGPYTYQWSWNEAAQMVDCVMV